ncbi:hypothetical protein ACFL7M_07140 [Thermodesulfobacteriota bacterium]
MNVIKHGYMAAIGLLLTILLGGCSGYGKIMVIPRSETVTIEDLEKNQHKYNVFYAGWHDFDPSCILFDPKEDNKKVIGNRWDLAKDPQWVSKKISWMKSFSKVYPVLQGIYGPDGQIYGFLYCIEGANTAVKAIDDNTLYIYDPSQDESLTITQ